MMLKMDNVHEILDSYTPLVKRIARSACYSSAAIDINDLFQVGEIAVLRAIKAYDPSCGTNIRSFVTRIVKQDIYNEAARFLGVFTVDHRVTSLAAKVNRLTEKGHSDNEIVSELNKNSSRNFDVEHVRDLRIAYNRRQHTVISEEDVLDEHDNETSIGNILDSVTQNDQERLILQHRLLGDLSVREMAGMLSISQRKVYAIESLLKSRIRIAIEGMTE